MAYPYVNRPAKFAEFLQKLKDIGVPESFSLKSIKSLGFTSSNDERFLPAIKFIGLLQNVKGGKPTELWAHDLKANFGAALAKGLKQGYADLFSQYPDAHLRDDEALRTFFAVHSGLGSDAVSKMVITFKSVCGLADFGAIADEEETKDSPVGGKSADNSAVKPILDVDKVTPPNKQMTVNINIQLQVPPDSTGEIYDKFFETMNKHLWPENK